MGEVELSDGIKEYEDTGGEGPVLVLLHGLAQNGSLWRNVVAELRPEHRCVVPTLPLGAHRRPMLTEADLSMRGLSRLVTEFLERLDLRAVSLVENDWGGAHLLLSERGDERVARVVLTSCEAFDNYPPGLPGRAARPWPQACRTAPAGKARRDRGQLHAHPRGPARRARPPHP
jgi:pimeloyl-ACP methyl ester carboxylesterase